MLSACKIADIVNQEDNMTLHLRMITRYVRNNKIVVPATPKGPPPGLVNEEMCHYQQYFTYDKLFVIQL